MVLFSVMGPVFQNVSEKFNSALKKLFEPKYEVVIEYRKPDGSMGAFMVPGRKFGVQMAYALQSSFEVFSGGEDICDLNVFIYPNYGSPGDLEKDLLSVYTEAVARMNSTKAGAKETQGAITKLLNVLPEEKLLLEKLVRDKRNFEDKAKMYEDAVKGVGLMHDAYLKGNVYAESKA